MKKKATKLKKPERLVIQTCVRFTKEQWARVTKLAKTMKLPVAEMLRTVAIRQATDEGL